MMTKGQRKSLRLLFQVDIDCAGRVTWQQLCSYLHLEYAERERASIPRAALLDAAPLIRHCPHNTVRGSKHLEALNSYTNWSNGGATLKGQNDLKSNQQTVQM